MTYWYSADADGAERSKVESIFKDDPESAAQEAAQLFWDGGGWECSWPVTFTIYATEDGPALGRFRVEMEAIPSFSAYEIEEVPRAD